MNSHNRMMMWGWLLAALTVGLGSAMVGSAAAQVAGDDALSRDEKLILLQTKQARLDLEKAKTEMDRRELELNDTKDLFEERIVTANEYYKAQQAYEEARISHEQAQIQLEQTRLEFLKNATLVRVSNAKKYRGPEGQTMMASVTLVNASDIAKARIVMSSGETGALLTDEETAGLLKVDNIIVTLWGTADFQVGDDEQRMRTAKAIIGDPFQHIVPELRLGESKELAFELLKRDTEQVAVQVEYLETSREYDVFLKMESLEDLPTIVSDQFDQHGDLGTTIRFNLHLERLAKTEQSFSLCVLNWPEEISFDFKDKKTKATMTTLKFSGEESMRAVDFEVNIPEKLDPNFIDASLPFYVVVTRPKEMESIYALRKKYGDDPIPPEEILKIKGNAVELVLIPKGVGKLDFIVGNLFKEIKQEETTDLKFSVMGSGTLPVYRVTPEISLPLEWEGEVTPRQVSVIEPDQKMLFTISVRPPVDVRVGEYTVNVEVEGHSGVEVIDAGEKNFTVKLVASGGATGTLILMVVLVVMVLGIAVASVKIARR